MVSGSLQNLQNSVQFYEKWPIQWESSAIPRSLYFQDRSTEVKLIGVKRPKKKTHGARFLKILIQNAYFGNIREKNGQFHES